MSIKQYDLIDNFKSITKDKNYVKLIKIIYNNHISDHIYQYFLQTRDFEKGLEFVEWAFSIINEFHDNFNEEELENIHISLVYNKLNFLDYLNRWGEYLKYYNHILNTTEYTLTYNKSRDDEEFNKFVLEHNGKFKYVHFLYPVGHRHRIIKRKFERWVKGHKVEHLKRHQQDKLSDEEINYRAIKIITSLKEFIES